MQDLLKELSKPFHPRHVAWKPGATTKDGTKCMALAYADLRAYQDRLDEVCGGDWSCRYVPWGNNRLICELTIRGITRSSTGEMASQDEKNGLGGTVGEAQAFKRACAMWGLGRSLYDLPSVWSEFDPKSKRITDAGKAELDRRYTVWYSRKVAQSNVPTTPSSDDDGHDDDTEGNTPSLAADADFGTRDDGNDDAPATDPGKVLSRMQLTRLNVLGVELYGSNNKWDEKRPALVEGATGGRITSSKQLTPEQADLLIAGLEKRVKEKRAQEAAARASRKTLPALNEHSNGVAA